MTVKDNFNYLTDVFTCADGGVIFVSVKSLFDALDRENDPRIVKMINDFTKIVKYAESKTK